MPNNFDLDAVLGTDEDDDPKGPKALRRYVKSIEKKNEELEAKIAAIEAEAKKSTFTNLLKAKNLPEKVAALYTGEPTEEGLSAWLNEFGDVLGVKADASADGTTADAGMTLGIDPALVAAQQAQAAIASGATAQTGDHASQTRIRGTKDRDELAAVLAESGITLI